MALGIPVEERHGKHYEDGAVVSDDIQSLMMKLSQMQKVELHIKSRRKQIAA